MAPARNNILPFCSCIHNWIVVLLCFFCIIFVDWHELQIDSLFIVGCALSVCFGPFWKSGIWLPRLILSSQYLIFLKLHGKILLDVWTKEKTHTRLPTFTVCHFRLVPIDHYHWLDIFEMLFSFFRYNLVYFLLQHFTPEEGRYDVIWIQWCIGQLPDDDFISFFNRAKVNWLRLD
jgi:hypothetical protein